MHAWQQNAEATELVEPGGGGAEIQQEFIQPDGSLQGNLQPLNAFPDAGVTRSGTAALAHVPARPPARTPRREREVAGWRATFGRCSNASNRRHEQGQGHSGPCLRIMRASSSP
jgi:hypothetical protein